jgi:hypothetical protein
MKSSSIAGALAGVSSVLGFGIALGTKTSPLVIVFIPIIGFLVAASSSDSDSRGAMIANACAIGALVVLAVFDLNTF